jgi:hypothetical protein
MKYISIFTLFIISSLFLSFSSMPASDLITHESHHIELNSFEKSHIDLFSKNIVKEIKSILKTNKNLDLDDNDIECPDCYGTLRSTYITEYCVGIKCRTRTLYRCSFDSDHEYWVYED